MHESAFMLQQLLNYIPDMHHATNISSDLDKAGKYLLLAEQIKALLREESDSIANMSNFCAAINDAFSFHWIGIYRVVNEELVLGPFQGPVACTRIGYEKGVCGTAWAAEKTMLVPDVESFSGHIACSALSRSELVVPIRQGNKVIGVLDIDSTELNAFDKEDQKGVEILVNVLEASL